MAQIMAQSSEVTDLLTKGGPFALGAGAVLAMGRLGWIRFPPSPEQTADKARLEKLTDDLINRQGTALTDAITSTRDVTKALDATSTTLAGVELASRATTDELARLTAAATALAASRQARPGEAP